MARKILLADDSVTAQNMGRKILADAGYEVITVNNGSAALKRVSDSKPDLIVLDVYMPGYSGLEVCQRLKDAPETAHIPVLLTVGKLEPFKPDEARRARADAHIVKPFEASELLSAMARLEDRMVATDGPRISTAVSGVERFGGERQKAMPSDADTGWKSRLRFPLRKKKEEESEPEEAGANFRDFRKGKGKAGDSVATPAVSAAAPAGQEPGLVPDIPRDITPEELDALSALAAKLDGPIPEAEDIASLAEEVGPLPQPAASNSAVAEEEKPAEAVSGKPQSAPVADFEVPAATGETVVAAAVENAAPVESAEAGVVPAAAETAKSDLEATENADVTAPRVTVNAATLIEAPAPVDQQDEPMFAVAPAAISGEEAAERKPVEETAVETLGVAREPALAEATVQQSHAAHAFDVVGVPTGVEPSKDEQSVVESQSEAAKTAEEEMGAAAQVRSVAAEVNTGAQQATEAEALAPTDEELAEALRLLTPSTGQADAGVPSHGTLVAAGQMLAEEAARAAGSSPRWVAEAVALTQEESSMSLEEEMFRSFAPQHGKDRRAGDPEPAAPLPLAKSGPFGDPGLAAKNEPPTGAAVAAASDAAGEASCAPVREMSESASKTATEAFASTELQSGEKVTEAKTASHVAEESAPSGTFADTTLQSEEEATVDGETTQAEASQSVAGADSVEDGKSSSDVGGDADMGKHGKESSSKSGWHQIRKPASTSAARDAVEAAKQADSDTAKEDSKAMAAAATAEGGSAGPDASAIASIVDSVLADLRPKIVEEIAKKLGKK